MISNWITIDIRERGRMRMGIQINPYPLRLDPEVMAKLRVVASQNGRSVNKEIEFRMREVIRAYETEHGPIRLEKDAR